ncbi:MAG TPA: hypothetical protein PKD85_16295 [Saprospiraceae bacterium]|nr:hypothetical protein [Saprospiraceae bacterium]
MNLPVDFKNNIERSLKERSTRFFESLDQASPNSIRINRSKYNQIFDDEEPIPWCDLGRYLPERPSYTLDPSFHAGSYYVQEASSMVLCQILLQLGLSDRPIKVLDLCAAPGGKTTLLHDYLHVGSVIVANEVIKNRAQILKENIIKWGCKNIIITSNDPSQFAKVGMTFDLILVDAPCSGEGMFRKDPAAVNEWSLKSVDHCALRQQRIIDDILPCLSTNGHIIYSTCTYNDDENINQVVRMLDHHQIESREIALDPSWGIAAILRQNAFGYQCYPHEVKGEGFFFAVLKKTNDSPSLLQNPILSKLKLLSQKEIHPILPFLESTYQTALYQHPNGDCYYLPEQIKEYTYIAQSMLHLQYAGVKIGTLQKQLFLPDHALALSDLIRSSIPKAALPNDQALEYLRRKISFIDSLGNGWQIAQYQGFNLGWFKQLGNRINNYYPTEWRVRMG